MNSAAKGVPEEEKARAKIPPPKPVLSWPMLCQATRKSPSLSEATRGSSWSFMV